ncbi:CASTOR/POLLUX/SYM8 ion channel, conserved domain [Dillenia turbinata]|uniref:CASTOR/POLLUX/SYM8 ion channel, conserved domain n=1 Tax=Dillenia turbinata TaxID=194707 RepID=A0AAN8WBA8_9MAGN
MQENKDGDLNGNPKKPERPPQLKRSKTTISSSSDEPSSSSASPAHFPGPLFPAVRRVSTAPIPSFNNHYLSPDSDVSTSASTVDRDWMYPSFLGPHVVRNRVTVKSSSKSPKTTAPKLELPPLPARRGSPSPSHSSDVSPLRSPFPAALPEMKVKPEKDLKRPPVKPAPILVSASASSSPSTTSVIPATSRRVRGLRNSFLVYLVNVTCMISVIYAVSLRIKIQKLEEDNVNLRWLCSENDNNSGEVLQHQDTSSITYTRNADSRTVALYIVLFTVIMPFLLFKYLDCFTQITIFSKRRKNNKEEVPLKKRIAYMVDVFFSVHPYAKLLALLFATIFLIGFGGLALYAVSDGTFSEALWLAWTFVADSGNHADRVGTGPRIVSVSISSGGMLIFAMMLGLVSDAISEKVDSLRKGKSEVIERNHVLILGWSDKLGSLLKQLAIANKSIGGGVIVVLAERDKEEMEMDIAKLEFDFMGTAVICRSGSPLILADLKKVSVSKARAIIVLASDENADQSDARALRVVLSLTGVKEGLSGHVVVEMSDLDNEPLVKLVGGELIETVVAHDVIGRLMIQCALQPGLAQIWEDILGFENAEFYIKRWPQLDGLQFGNVLISFPDAVPCGIKVAAEGGKIILNPADDHVLKEGDEVLVIAEDDDTYAPGPMPEVRPGHFPNNSNPKKYPEKILFCGWRRDIDDMIMVLEAFLAPGSELWMFNEVPEKEREKKLTDGGLDVSRLTNIKLVHREGNAVIKRHLESLPLETFDSILILADESLEDSVVHSDSRSLATLLLIRDIQSKRLPYKDTKSNSLRQIGFSHSSWIREMQQASDKSIIISEILDSRTRNLVSVSRISDYVLSNELVSMALAMVAEDRQINRVLEELFAESGNEMCIRAAEFYLYDQEELSFYDIMVRGRQRQEIVIGYRLATEECAVINPSDKSKPRKWSLDDVFVIISYGE